MDAKIDISPGSFGTSTTIDASPFFRFVMANAGETCILVMDEAGVILSSNIAVKTALGYASEDLAGRSFHMLFKEEDRKKGLPDIELKRVHKTGRATDRNYVIHKNQSSIWVHGESVLVKDGDGNIFIVKLIYDINEQKLLEASLHAANEELTRVKEDLKKKNEILLSANKDLDTFVYTASHDLKAPLHNLQALISHLIEELSQKSKEKDEVQEMIDMIYQSLNNFTNTINDLATTGRVQAEGEAKAASTNLKESMEDVKGNLKELIEKNEAKIIENFQDQSDVNISPKNLRSILYNLVSNAIKYRSKERNPIVKVSTERVDENFVLLKVEDNGLGIKEEDQANLFIIYKRFHQHVEGTGVGLSLVKRIVENNGGRIEVKSELGKGSTFNILLKR